jgi:hypothetical protein
MRPTEAVCKSYLTLFKQLFCLFTAASHQRADRGQRVAVARAKIDRSARPAAAAEGPHRAAASAATSNRALLGSRATELGRAESVAPAIGCDSASFGAQSKKMNTSPQFSFC